MMKRILRIQPVIYFDIEDNEDQEAAEDRFLNILNDEGFDVATYTATLIERTTKDEVRAGD